MPRPANKVEAIEKNLGQTLAELIEHARKQKIGQLELAQQLGLSSNYLGYYCKKHGIKRLGRRSRYEITPEHHAKMVAAAAQRTQKCYTLGGVTKSTKEWASELKLPIATFRWRVKTWPEDNVLSGESPFEKNKGHGGRRV